MSAVAIPIRPLTADGYRFEECPDCAHCNVPAPSACDECDEADCFEEDDE